MNVEEALDELRSNILHDDAGLASGVDDKLWSDETLIRYLNDAQRRFARRSYALRDASTPEVVEVALEAGVSSYTLHRSIRAVVGGRIDGKPYDLVRSGYAILSDTPVRRDFDINQLLLQTGIPVVFSTDERLELDENASVVMTVAPTPSTDVAGTLIKLRVARMPLATLTLDKTDADLEIPEEYQLDMLEWVGVRCHRTSDLDGASDKAVLHERRFEQAVTEALQEQRRKMYAPMRFAIGAGGFSWRR